MNMNTKLQGLIAAVFTPFHQDGSLNLNIISEYADRMITQGVSGIFVNGSSGEGMLLTVEERKALLEKWLSVAKDKLQIIVHVGSSSVNISKDLARHAESAGADAIASMAPNFFPSSDINIIAQFCREVAAAAKNTPFYYYHLPLATGTHIKVHKLLEIVAHSVPNFAGVKYTHTDFMDMHQCITLNNQQFDILHGHDEILINGLVLGIKGAIGTTFNFIPELYTKIIASFEDGDLVKSREYQMQSIQVVDVMLSYVNAIIGGKAIMKLSGLDCGPGRLPLRNLTETEFEQLRKELNDIGYFKLLADLKT